MGKEVKKMKCKACGYQEDESIVRFIHIIGTFLVEKESNWGSPHKEECSLYACPECKTVILRDDTW